MDTMIGRLLNTLADLGRLEDTVVMVTCDHGTELLDHGRFGKSADHLYAHNTQLNWIVRLPDGHPQAGSGARQDDRRVRAEPRHRADGARPDGPAGQVARRRARIGRTGSGARAGRSIEGADRGHHRRGGRDHVVTGWGDMASVRDREFNYVGAVRDPAGTERVYDLRADPLEMKDVASDHPAVVQEGRRRWRRCWGRSWARAAGRPDEGDGDAVPGVLRGASATRDRRRAGSCRRRAQRPGADGRPAPRPRRRAGRATPGRSTPHLDALAAREPSSSTGRTRPPRSASPPGRACSPVATPTPTARWTNRPPLPRARRTIGHLAGGAGIATGAVGKMHFVGPDRHRGLRHPLGPRGVRRAWSRRRRATPPPGWPPGALRAARGGHAGCPTLPDDQPLLDHGNYVAGPSPFPAARHIESYVTREGIRFLEAHRHERWVLWCSSYFKPHEPIRPPRRTGSATPRPASRSRRRGPAPARARRGRCSACGSARRRRLERRGVARRGARLLRQRRLRGRRDRPAAGRARRPRAARRDAGRLHQRPRGDARRAGTRRQALLLRRRLARAAAASHGPATRLAGQTVKALADLVDLTPPSRRQWGCRCRRPATGARCGRCWGARRGRARPRLLAAARSLGNAPVLRCANAGMEAGAVR